MDIYNFLEMYVLHYAIRTLQHF